MKKVTLALVILGFVLPISVSSVYATPAFTMSDGLGIAVLTGPTNTIGWQFEINNSFYVDSLGVFDNAQDGLSVQYDVGIFDASGGLLTSATVDTNDPLINQFRYQSIAPTQLFAGDVYYIGAFYSDINESFVLGANDFLTDPRLTFLNSGFGTAGPVLTAPLDIFGPIHGLFGPNFTISPVPEPSTLLLLGGGLIGLAFAVRRRRKE